MTLVLQAENEAAMGLDRASNQATITCRRSVSICLIRDAGGILSHQHQLGTARTDSRKANAPAVIGRLVHVGWARQEAGILMRSRSDVLSLASSYRRGARMRDRANSHFRIRGPLIHPFVQVESCKK